MSIPFRLKATTSLADPLGSDQCEIEQHFVEYLSPIGGYYQLDIDNLPAIPCSKVEHSYGKILNILGLSL